MAHLTRVVSIAATFPELTNGINSADTPKQSKNTPSEWAKNPEKSIPQFARSAQKNYCER